MAAPSMAPPTPEVDFAAAKSPTETKRLDGSAHDGPTARHSLVGDLGQLLIFAAIFVYTFAQFFYFSTSYEALSARIGEWFGVTADGGGHDEMVIPTYFLLFAVLPFAVSVLTFELLCHHNLHRITSCYAVKATTTLRLKPRTRNWISPWSWGEILFLAVLLGGNANVFYYYYNACVIYYRDSGLELNFTAYLDCCGLGMGYASMFNMAFLFLPSARNSAWMELLNISYANGIKYHRWVGVLTVATALLHTVFYYWMYIREDMWVMMSLPCFHCDAGDDGKAAWMNFLGLIALLVMLLIAATSIPYVRRRLYGVFYSVHQLFPVAVVFSVLHYNPILLAILPAFVVYLAGRTVSSVNGSTPVVVKELAALGTDVVKITLQSAVTGSKRFHVGQFAYLNVPIISKTQWHPFTISTSPRMGANEITFLLKVQGNWTSQLAKQAEVSKESGVLPVVYVDGYYGTSLEVYDQYSSVCLVAGGTGVTPLLAVLHDMVARLSRGENPTQKVYFVFTFRELALLEEIHPLLVRIRELDPQEKHFFTRLFLSQQPDCKQLEAPIDHHRLSENLRVVASGNGKVKVKTTPMPFSAPLRSSLVKAVLYLVVYVGVCLILAAVKYGQKVQAGNANLWPLQNFVEIALVFAIVPLVTLGFVLAERWCNNRLTTSASAVDPSSGANSSISSDVRTLQDLMVEYRVTLGEHPMMTSELRRALDAHDQRAGVTFTGRDQRIGLFISGPKTLKMATERAITELGAASFDVHEEEFEL